MSLTLKEKLNGVKTLAFYVSPYTDRKLKPFIFRDNVMRPTWIQLMEEIEQFDKDKLKNRKLENLCDMLHDHLYFDASEGLVIQEISRTQQLSMTQLSETRQDCASNGKDNNSSERKADDGSHSQDDRMFTTHYDDKDKTKAEDNITTDKIYLEGNGNQDKGQCEKEGNVLENKECESKRMEQKIRENIPTKNKSSSSAGRTIDFCYVREEHIRAINTLVAEHFWPNISMEECTLYPEFTVVALCKKLVVGLGAMIPNPNKHNETYITYLATRHYWENVGIGSFMLYHLIATCQSTHITLHCSVSRYKALNLYFKFGFKVQCVVLNFYKPYLSAHPNPDMSPHAYFLKYSRNIN
uniref:Cysteine-rich protein 2-binding protein n=1 Tax=Cacopsylla melanoneura TaxID=428564 RepID=A0A8D9AG78_9HEMI